MKSITLTIPSLSLRSPSVVEQEKQNHPATVLENKPDTAKKDNDKWAVKPDLLKVRNLLNVSGEERKIMTGGAEKTLSHDGHVHLTKEEERVGWVELSPAPTSVVKTTIKLSASIPAPEVGKLIVFDEETARFVWDTTDRRDVVYINNHSIVIKG
jgi:hypothetical protein